MSFTILVACSLWWFIGWLKQNNKGRELVAWLIANGVIVLAFSFWAPTLAAAMRAQVTLPGDSVQVPLEAAKRVAYIVYTFSVGETLSPLNPLAWIGLGIVGLLSIAAVVMRRGIGAAWAPLLFLAVVSAFSIVVNLSTRGVAIPQALSNQMLFVFPFSVMWIAWRLASIPSRIVLAVGGALVSVYTIAILNYFQDREFMKPILTVPWHDIMRQVRTSSAPANRLTKNLTETGSKRHE